MADEEGISPKKAKEVNKELELLRKNLSAVGRTLLDNAKTDKEQDKISKLLIKAKQEELKLYENDKKSNTATGRLKKLQLVQELKSLKDHHSELQKSRGFVGAFGAGLKKIPVVESAMGF
jgi:NCAIR mutase (PurE)-related protein